MANRVRWVSGALLAAVVMAAPAAFTAARASAQPAAGGCVIKITSFVFKPATIAAG